MSWIGALAGKAEDFLNKIDNTAATALHTTDDDPSKGPTQRPQPPTGFEWSRESGGPPKKALTPSAEYSPFLSVAKSMTSSNSVPSNLNHMNGDHPPTATGQMSRSVSSKNKDKDEELFEFLNNGEVKVDTTKRKDRSKVNGKRSHGSSGASTPTKTPTSDVAVIMAQNANETDAQDNNGRRDAQLQNDSPDGSASDPAAQDNDDVLGNTDSSSGYHSSGEETAQQQSDQLSSLDLENKLLRQEVDSLIHEMQSMSHRAQSSNEELLRLKQTFKHHNQRLSETEQLLREANSKESDLREALGAKDSQLAVLRVRLAEADQELSQRQDQLVSVETQKERILADHTSASDVQGQALDTLKDKLQEAEMSLRRERDNYQKELFESQERCGKLEQMQQSLSTEISSLQKRFNEEKARSNELTIQMRSSRSEVEMVKQELHEYKEKATRILQSKEKLISSLKEGGLSSGQEGASAAEFEELLGERDLLKEEVQRMQMTVENQRQEIGELEMQLQQDSDEANDQMASLQESLQAESHRREDSEQECARQKQELNYAHEELMKQKSTFQSRMQDREGEINRLRAQLTTRSMSSSSQQELENRLRMLTESLIEKQTMLESLSTEKNSLTLQMERMETQCREAEACALRATSTAVHMNEDDDVRQRLPGFMRESPMDGEVARKVKRAANSIDKLGVRLGVFLRRYPVARVFVISYMVLLHLWVMIVLLTYQPEVHSVDYQPHPPGSL